MRRKKKAQGDLGFFLVWLFYLDTRCGANTFPPPKRTGPWRLLISAPSSCTAGGYREAFFKTNLVSPGFKLGSTAFTLGWEKPLRSMSRRAVSRW